MARTTQKRHGLLVFLTLSNWLIIGLMVFFTDPEIIKDLIVPDSYLLMGCLLFSGIFLLLTIVFLSAKRSLRWTIAILLLIYLKVYGLATIINAALVMGALLCFEVYLFLNRQNRGLGEAKDKVANNSDQDILQLNKELE